jgi:hypothetical protein
MLADNLPARPELFPESRLATVCCTLVSQPIKPRTFDQGPGRRGDAQGDPCERRYRGGSGEGLASDREAAGLRLTTAAKLVAATFEETLS